METLNMSRKERKRLIVLLQVKHRNLLLRDAADVMVLSYRQAKRVWRRYQAEGDAGLERSKGAKGKGVERAKGSAKGSVLEK
jgi:predicted ArsR family transcriptional regulator